MKQRLFIILTIVVIGIISSFLYFAYNQDQNFAIETPPGKEHYIGKVSLSNNISIRIIVLKHCRERIADQEGEDIVEIANLAATEGLDIKDLGSHHVNNDGALERLVYTKKLNMSSLREFIDKQMKIEASPGDTLILYTTGHGGRSGNIQILGSRKELGIMFAEVAEKNEQETLWWQSSCYSAAGLPDIKEMNENQQKLFSMIASSPANEVTYWGDQQEPMYRMFSALAKESEKIDPDQNQIVTAKELGDFLNTVERGAGDLVFAASPDEPIFGWLDVANMLPIVDPSGKEREGSENYIPHP